MKVYCGSEISGVLTSPAALLCGYSPVRGPEAGVTPGAATREQLVRFLAVVAAEMFTLHCCVLAYVGVITHLLKIEIFRSCN